MENEKFITREDLLTSTGKKILRHPEQVKNYFNADPRSIISAHISPEGNCNLNCSYCSVRLRKRKEHINIFKLENYIDTLVKYGCKAVILTGGGEPTLYPDFDKLMNILSYYNLQVGLITNGTMIKEKSIKTYPFSWVRISVNTEDKWIVSMMDLSYEDFHPNTRVGLSYIYDPENYTFSPQDLINLSGKLHALYIRILPDCQGDNMLLADRYLKLHRWLGDKPDPLFMVQHKIHGAPSSVTCHQAYLRPYLSEIHGGTIFPCDSIPLNNSGGKFDMKYAIGPMHQLEDFLTRKIGMNFNPSSECKGCVFTRNINLLQDINLKKDIPWIEDPIIDENFI